MIANTNSIHTSFAPDEMLSYYYGSNSKDTDRDSSDHRMDKICEVWLVFVPQEYKGKWNKWKENGRWWNLVGFFVGWPREFGNQKWQVTIAGLGVHSW